MRRRAFLFALFASAGASAQGVIESGREQEILALFRPHRLATEVTPGWKLWEVQVSPQSIRVEVRGPGDRRAAFRMIESEDPARSFRIERESAADPGGAIALETLEVAIRNNDHGGFFRTAVVPRKAQRADRSRFLAVPIVTTVVAVGVMVFVRRSATPRAR